MEFTNEERSAYCKGIATLIRMKENEIKKVQRRTDEDYVAEKELTTSLGGTYSLEVCKAEDIKEIEKEILQYRALYEKMSNTNNRLLLLPRDIQLMLTEK